MQFCLPASNQNFSKKPWIIRTRGGRYLKIPEKLSLSLLSNHRCYSRCRDRYRYINPEITDMHQASIWSDFMGMAPLFLARPIQPLYSTWPLPSSLLLFLMPLSVGNDDECRNFRQGTAIWSFTVWGEISIIWTNKSTLCLMRTALVILSDKALYWTPFFVNISWTAIPSKSNQSRTKKGFSCREIFTYHRMKFHVEDTVLPINTFTLWTECFELETEQVESEVARATVQYGNCARLREWTYLLVELRDLST